MTGDEELELLVTISASVGGISVSDPRWGYPYAMTFARRLAFRLGCRVQVRVRNSFVYFYRLP